MKIQLKAFFNCCLAEYYYARRRIIVKNKPRVFAIELTNFCNLNCLMCPRDSMKRKKGFMSFGLFKKIIKQIKGHVGFVWLHNFGEPLFHPQLEELINHCAENNIRTGLSTNTTMLDQKKAVMILNSKLDHIVLSVDGSTKQTHQNLRQGSEFEKSRNNVLNFLRLKRELKKATPFTEAQIIRMDETEDEIGAFERQWGDLADNVLVKDFCAWANQVEGIAQMKKKPLLYFSRRSRRGPCMAFWRDGVVLWNGDLVPCCMDFDGKMVLGNLDRESLEDIWNSEKAKRMREEHLDNNFNNPLCRDCKEWPGRQRDIGYLLFKILPYSARLFKKFLAF